LHADGTLAEASYSRTARRLLEGVVYVPTRVLGSTA
jgi:2-methylaconitate cis-trans-isomerase PrpF